nr:MFS transporter [Ktedonobacteraceae bacterium]
MKNLVNKNLAVFRVRSYSCYFLGSSVSWIGNSMQFIAESWLALQLTHQAFSVAIVLVATSLPGTVLSPLLGVYIDRFDRKWLAAWMDIFRGCVLLAMPILWWANLLQPWHIYLVTLLVSIGDTVFTPTISALIQEVVPQEHLLSANSFNSVALQIGSLLGASLAAIIIVISSAPMALLVDALTFSF